MILLVAVGTSMFIILIAYIYREKFKQIRQITDTVNVFFDALGLAAFSITGVEIVCLASVEENALLVITLGAITGVGGGGTPGTLDLFDALHVVDQFPGDLSDLFC